MTEFQPCFKYSLMILILLALAMGASTTPSYPCILIISHLIQIYLVDATFQSKAEISQQGNKSTEVTYSISRTLERHMLYNQLWKIICAPKEIESCFNSCFLKHCVATDHNQCFSTIWRSRVISYPKNFMSQFYL